MSDRGPLKIAAVYFLFGFLWILVSDTLVLWVASSADQVARLQTAKGWIYVLLTTILVYVLMRMYSSQKNAAHQETIRAGELLSQTLEQKKLLVRELHHRVKNNLQTVLAFLNLADKSEPSDTVRQRVYAMAATHEIAMAFADPTAIDLNELLQRLVAATPQTPGQRAMVTTTNAATDGGQNSTRRATLTVNQAVPLGLYVAEILRRREQKRDVSDTDSVEVELTIEETEWHVKTVLASGHHTALGATSRALCDAWATQLGGHVNYAGAETLLSVPRHPVGK